jgi:2-succinyl-6-hydroxy-2,4-cyclohexadiene-1-carboxylate synthase
MPPSHPTPDEGAATLHAATSGDGPRLVLAHGFTQTHRIWGGLDGDLAADHTVVAVDLPGHGGSADVRADLVAGAFLLGEAGGAADYLGYSMGARFALHLAVARPDLVRRLVLVSGTAGIEAAGERSERRRADEALAERLDPLDGDEPEDTVAGFVARWVANPMFGPVPPAANAVDERCTNTAAGLASSLRLAGTGTQEPLWDHLPGVRVPVLVVTGARDAKFTDLGRRLVASWGGVANHVVIDDADHAPHLQHPGAVAAAVGSFLDGPD